MLSSYRRYIRLRRLAVVLSACLGESEGLKHTTINFLLVACTGAGVSLSGHWHTTRWIADRSDQYVLYAVKSVEERLGLAPNRQKLSGLRR
ncbi:hypothetical protein C8Q76DRAFT_726690 [Earliella scabrosa]|nr:hypothetical protein C8Q76DRAFT_726690 [Earliella scabrosa]